MWNYLLKHSIVLALVFTLVLVTFVDRDVVAIHLVTATPSTSSVAFPIDVTLTSSANSTIYYTTDGSDPTNSSLVYSGQIAITNTTTLKFFSVDASDSHASAIITEIYTFDPFPPTVVSTDPDDGTTRIQKNSTISATFSEPMDENTINEDTFVVIDETREDQVSGSIAYDSDSNTAIFTPTEELILATLYSSTLRSNITDSAGNSLAGDFSWTFTTGGSFTIFLTNIEDDEFISGSSFTATPDPFTLTDSLLVEDNDEEFDSDPADGVITVENVEVASFMLQQTVVPAGFAKIYDNLIITVHPTKPSGGVFVQNLPSSTSITDFPAAIFVPPPDLSSEQFGLYEGNAFQGFFSGIHGDLPAFPTPVSTVEGAVPFAFFATSTTLDQVLEDPPFAMVFTITASGSLTGPELFQSFLIPMYPLPNEEIASQITYSLPAFVIPYEESNNNFLLTPVISKVYPGLNLLLDQPSFVESNVAKVDRVNMTLAQQGSNIGFSFGITNTPQPGTPDPPLDAPALFLDVGFVGDIDFSDPSSFQSSPKIDILVNKTLPGFPQLPDGCADFQLLMFNEGTGEWEVISQLRSPTKDTDTQCGFTLQPEHFSKFAVGGVKGQTISTESSSGGGGGGGGGTRSAGITSVPSGNDVEATVTTVLGPVSLRFESVEVGSGQLKVESNDLSAFADIFSELAIMPQDNDEHGIIRLEATTYVTAGNIFNIDASSVNFQGVVDVTIPYDENTAVLLSGSESDVRFLHYNDELGIWEDATSSVNDITNTVSGRVDSFSPVIAGIIISEKGITFDEGYFEENPLARMEIGTPSFVVSEQTGEVTISTTVKNMQRMDQEYVAVVQIVDANNIAYYIDWATGSAASAQDSTASINWKAMEKGSYSIMIFICTDLDNPILLSTKVLADIDI